MPIRLMNVLFFLAGMTFGSPAQAAEEPPHTITFSRGAIEIRNYAPMILAEVDASGDMAEASNRGFRPLANYIFGDNHSAGGLPGTPVEMTAPVLQSRPTKIAMTAPVTQARSGGELWRVAFVMPAEWTMQTLPHPNDSHVTLREVPARRMAAIRFSGGPDEKRFERKAQELTEFLFSEGYEIVAEPLYARYNPPWTPTFLRRNEVLIEIRP